MGPILVVSEPTPLKNKNKLKKKYLKLSTNSSIRKLKG